MIRAVTWGFDLFAVADLKPQRSILEGTRIFWGDWGREWLKMLLKRFWLVYHVNALVFFPVTVYEASVWFFGILSLWLFVKKKCVWYPLLFAGMYGAPVLLTLAESDVTKYRSCQYMAFFNGVCVFSVCILLRKWLSEKSVKIAISLLGGVLVFNQASWLNSCFYDDYGKYENTRETLNSVAYEIRSRYGLETPVIFTGHYDVPIAFRQRYYADFDSKEFARVAAVADLVDEHLKEKYYADYGYSFVGEAENPFILWALEGFDGTDRELHKFYEMHGRGFKGVYDTAVAEWAKQVGKTMPRWPAEGSVSLRDGYVLVHF